MPSIWRYFDKYKAHCEENQTALEIAGWKGCTLSSIYYHPDGHRERDVIFPGNLYNRVAEKLGLPLKGKKAGRVAHGRTMSVMLKKHQFSRKSKSK